MRTSRQRRRRYNTMLAKIIRDIVFIATLFLGFMVCRLSCEPATAKEAHLAASNARILDVETIPFIVDAQRILMNVTFKTWDGGSRTALTWFNMGMTAPVLTKALYRELGLDRGHPLTMKLGGFSSEAAPETVVDGDGGLANPDFAQRFAPHPVEAMLPAAFFQQAVITLDYQHRTLTLAQPGARKPAGVAVPFAINPKTGLIAVDVEVDSKHYPMVIDAGSGYSWIRGQVLAEWLAAHRDWWRARGAVGLSNYNMLDFPFEKEGVSYWQVQTKADAHDLDQVAITLMRRSGGFFVSGFVRKANLGPKDEARLDGCEIGDELVAVDGLSARGASIEQILSALHGPPGARRHLVIEHHGTMLNIDAPVTAFD